MIQSLGHATTHPGPPQNAQSARKLGKLRAWAEGSSLNLAVGQCRLVGLTDRRCALSGPPHNGRQVLSCLQRRDAVELYRSTPGATVVGICGRPGHHGQRPVGVVEGRRGRGARPWSQGAGEPTPDGETPAQEVKRLRARVGELEANERKLSTERDILRAAAKYFAGETDR
jgi:transposase